MSEQTETEKLAIAQLYESIARWNAAASEKLASEASNDAATDPDAKMRELLPLLAEYTQKIRQYKSDTGLFGGPLRSTQSLAGFYTAARKLSQFVSQRLNRVKDEFLKMELELRLAEYEAMLGVARGPLG